MEHFGQRLIIVKVLSWGFYCRANLYATVGLHNYLTIGAQDV